MAASTQADLIGNRYGHLAWRRRVVTYSTASTATYFVNPRESGAIFFVPNVSTALFSLPKISSLALGLNYQWHFALESDLADYNIVSTLDSSANIILTGVTSAASTVQAITPLSTIAALGVEVTAISSILWLSRQVGHSRPSSGNSTAWSTVDYIIGQWGTGTTQA